MINPYPKETTELGENHTGVSMDVEEARKTIEGAQESATIGADSGVELARVRSEYVAETEGVGSMPAVGLMKGIGQGLAPQKLALLLDKLGERAAFERMGVRLYDALIAKVEGSEDPSAPEPEELREIRGEELSHFRLVRRCLEELGGDPTMETPCADAAGVASRGVLQVVADPRTSVAQSLSAVLTAELTDNAGWELLLQLTETLGFNDMAISFEKALSDERRHLEKVKSWVASGVMSRVS
jgi:rubrerythrin